MHYSTVVAIRKNSGVSTDDILAPYNSQPDGNEPWLEFEVAVGKGKFREEAIRIIDGQKKASTEATSEKDKKHLESNLKLYEKYLYEKNYAGIFSVYYGGGFFKGDWGYWNNPNGFWDWYVVGGRWANYFKLKSEAKDYKKHLPDAFDNTPPKVGYADSAPLRYIDWEGKRADAEKEAGELYEKIKSQLGNGKLNKELTALTSGIRISKSNRLEPKSKFVKRCGENGLIPYAFIDEDGILHEKVWDASPKTDKKRGVEYENKWKEFLKNADQDTILTIVDCHN